MRREFIPLSIPNFGIEEEKNVLETIRTEQVSPNGKFVSDFEKKLALYSKVNNVIACQSGTAGLHLALLSLGIERGTEVIVPTLTFIASANVVRYVGAEPVFMDCDDFLNLDVEKVQNFCERECIFDGEKLINKASGRIVRAILPVHIFGNLADMEHLMEIAKKYNLKVIEDATEAVGCYFTSGKYKGRFAGTIGDIGVYSFNVNKIITSGGGGAILTSDGELANRCKYYSTQAKEDALRFVHGDVGYNYRMGNVQAAIALAQLDKLEDFIRTKKSNYEVYRSKGIDLLPFQNNIRSNYWFYSHVTNQRDNLIDCMKKNKIQSRPIWALCHMQAPYRHNQNYYIENAIKYHKVVVNIPCSTNMSLDDIDAVSEIIRNFS